MNCFILLIKKEDWLEIITLKSIANTYIDFFFNESFTITTYEPRREIVNIVVWSSSKGSDKPAHTRSLLRAFAIRLNIL